MKDKIIDFIYKISIVALILSIMVLCYLCTIGILLNRDMGLKFVKPTMSDYYNAYNKLWLESNKNICLMTDEEYKQYVENDMGIHFYIYTERDNISKAGLTNCFSRQIIMNSKLTGYEYCRVFVHEMLHLKYISADEKYIAFETFKYLYNDDKLHDIGVSYGMAQIEGKFYGDQNSREYIVDYLTKN